MKQRNNVLRGEEKSEKEKPGQVPARRSSSHVFVEWRGRDKKTTKYCSKSGEERGKSGERENLPA
jgi:hypothetical protein